MKVTLKPLHEQVMVITGASSGIGLCTAKMAAKFGTKIVLVARSGEAMDKIVEEITKDGGQALAVTADVCDETAMRQAARKAIEHFGGFDTWVNNAGVSIYGRIEEVPLEDHRRLFETNFWGTVIGSRIAVDYLRTRGGAIINVGSALSDRAIPLQGMYSASKHAVRGFTEALRMEIEEAQMPISLTLVKPGAIDTPYIQHAKNYLAEEPKNPPPVYAPEVVARVILHAATRPVRDIFAGGAGKAISLTSAAPRLTDRFMEKTMFATQHSGKAPRPRDEHALDKPSNDPRIRGNYDGFVKPFSMYSQAVMHPMIAGLIVAGLGGLLVLALSSTARRTVKRPIVQAQRAVKRQVTNRLAHHFA